MARITKAMIASAMAELDTIHELARESFNGAGACYQYHARSANNQIATLEQAGQPLPAWLTRDKRFLAVCGWRTTNL